MGEIASVVAAPAALGALYFTWRTVIEARAARTDDERACRRARLENLGIALTELATQLRNGARAPARLTQARARVLWLTAEVELADVVREVLVTPITGDNEAELAKTAEDAIEVLLTGFDDYLRAERGVR